MHKDLLDAFKKTMQRLKDRRTKKLINSTEPCYNIEANTRKPK